MAGLKPWIPNPPEGFTGQASFVQSAVTHPDVSPNPQARGDYPTTVPTKAGGAGELKTMGGGTPDVVNAGTPVAHPIFQSGTKRGSDSFTEAALKNTKRTIVP